MHTPKSPKSTKPVEGPQSPSTVFTHTNPYQSALNSLIEEARVLKRTIESDLTKLMQRIARYRKSKKKKDEMNYKKESWYLDERESMKARALRLKSLELKLITLKSRVDNGI